MLRIIINADDCGYSKEVDDSIEYCIQNHLISSTTIMANMTDFSRAVSMFREYEKLISFGFHINLTEGSPMLYSQELLDIGFYTSVNGKLLFNKEYSRYNYFSLNARNEIYNEIKTQLVRILDSGVRVSHFDSHHHIHNGTFILPVVCKLAKQMHVNKIRSVKNFGYPMYSLSGLARESWRVYLKILDPHVKITNYFTSFTDFISVADHFKLRDNCTIELSCHPGGIYAGEIRKLSDNSLQQKLDCIIVPYSEL
jgi:predicted glycoside hydrolase/deacetylase ChbG (UPF0249 family)